jgi:hypothetical protein
MWFKLVLFILSTAGLTYIITKSKALLQFRDLFNIGDNRRFEYETHKKKLKASEVFKYYAYYLLTCPLCMGLWCGLLLYHINIEWLTYALIGSISAYVISRF